MNVEVFCFDAVAPVRERGLKSLTATVLPRRLKRRSREGAWIEMRRDFKFYNENTVAPVRERGLKCKEVSRWLPGPCVAPVRERGLKLMVMS